MLVTFQIVQVIMQAVMLEKALFKVPHEHGMFEAPENCEFSESEDEDHVHRNGSISNKDDDYKVV